MTTLLIPREHGTYGQVGAPLLTAIAVGDGRPAVWLFTAAVLAAYCGHESFLVLTGQRGARAEREGGDLARRVLAGLLTLSAACGAAGLYLMPRAGVTYMVIPAVLAVVMSGICVAKREHTAAGEITAAVTLSAAGIPVALGGGASVAAALAVWMVFGAGFAVVTVAVRSVTARVRRPDDRLTGYVAAALAAGGLLVGEWLVRSGAVAPLVARAPALLFFAALSLALVRPNPRRLRAVGWGLAAVALVTVVVLAAALRA